MTDIAEISQEALAKLFASGKVHEMVERQLEATIASLIKDTMRDYSDFGKQLRAAIESSLPTKFNDLGISEYNEFVIKAVKLKLEALQNDQWRKEIEAMLDKMLRAAEPEIKLSTFAERVKEQFNGSNYSHNDSFTFLVEDSSNRDGYYWIFFDKDPDKEKYRCTFRVAVSNDGSVYAVTINDADPKKGLFLGPYSDIERALMQMYYGKTKLIRDIDGDDIDTSLEGCHCD